MRVIYTHFNQFDYLRDRNSVSRFLLYLSAFSWKYFYPEDTVVLYGDEETVDYVNVRSDIRFWDEVNLVPDREKVRKALGISEHYWAWPRVYTALTEKEPCCIVDIDVVLVQDIKKGLNLDLPWAVRYSVDDPVEMEIHKIPEIQPLVGEWYYSGGLIYHPHPDELAEITNTVIALDHNPGFQKAVAKYGYAAAIIGVEQNIPCHYYEDLKHYKTEMLWQANTVKEARKLPRGFYHAMDRKYTESVEEKVDIIVSLAEVLHMSKQNLLDLLRKLDFDEDFCSRCSSIFSSRAPRVV